MRSKSEKIRWNSIFNSYGAATLTLSAGAFLLAGWVSSPVQAQLPSFLDLNSLPPKVLNQDQSARVDSACIRLSDRWREQILDKPEVLGVDDFGDRGVIIRVWIKTQPLKQWEVAREFRRRLKVALDEAGISIPMPQQEVWFTNSLPTKSSQDSQTTSRS